ncbi:GNAT family N-acetyltransferase [Planococcus sp. 107-1]|uniref:GNAT family N-acetyltransferase n=1 Tax=Planococcus sp. 107-1 TaxID=2908840 RepID=UPI001F381E47|nr:GNAT family N-acetyltransferase [Planococcus sp. 107-1]UJF26175.1 GNAT family N-acetyltransferase [Planococcus sp. 107-1]
MISIITNDETGKWNEIVKGFTNFDVYYLAEYTKAFEVHGDGEPILFYYQGNNFKAINVVMKRDIALDEKFEGEIPAQTYFDIATPYGYGGFLLEGEVTEENISLLNREYSSICNEKGIVSEFVRFHPILKNSNRLTSMYDVVDLGKTITMKLETPEQIWNDLIGKNRNVIRKARNAGIKIYWGRNSQLIENFIEMYNATMEKDNAKDYYYFKEDFYASVLEDLRYNSMIFYAVYEEKIISMSMILFSNNQMHYHFSASVKNHQHLAPTNLLLLEAACWGAKNGYKTLHLGGGLGSQEDSLYKFKKAFNKNSDTIFSVGKKIFSEDIYIELLKINKGNHTKESTSNFFPKYRG